MPEHRRDEHETGIEPSIRRIGRLPRSALSARPGGAGVLTPFVGFLAGERHRSSPNGQPSLSYLTLQPLVVAGLSSGGDGGTSEAAEQGDRGPGESQGAESDSGGPTDRERLTVREYISQDHTASSGAEPAVVRGQPGRSAPVPTDPGPSDGDEQPEGGDVADLRTTVDRPPAPTPEPTERLTVLDRWRRPASDTERRRELQEEEGKEAARASAGAGSTGPTGTAADHPPTVPDRSEDAGPLDSTGRGSGQPAEPAGRPHQGGDADGPGPAGEGPELIVRDTGSPERVGGDSGRASESAAGTSGPERVGRGEQPAEMSGSRGSASSERMAPETSTDTDQSRSPLAFDSVTDPAFDRFVERLARRLERRERIERERRGR